jgi:hypothetical protein
MNTSPSPAFAHCEELFASHPELITDEGDAGQIMPVVTGGRRLRLVRHDTPRDRFYRLYPMDSDLVCEEPSRSFLEAVPAHATGESPS